jgi:hypothetical protein
VAGAFFDQCAVVEESVAFSFSWYPGATGWQVRHGKLLDLVSNNSETMFCASKEALVNVLKGYAKRCCWIMLRGKIGALLIVHGKHRASVRQAKVHMRYSTVNALIDGTRPFP